MIFEHRALSVYLLCILGSCDSVRIYRDALYARPECLGKSPSNKKPPVGGFLNITIRVHSASEINLASEIKIYRFNVLLQQGRVCASLV